MSLNCVNIDSLKNFLENMTDDVNSETIGKVIYRIEDVVCSVYDNGTVLLQGKNNKEVISQIKTFIEVANNKK